jgi:membrane-associated phospholipid phosphatase
VAQGIEEESASTRASIGTPTDLPPVTRRSARVIAMTVYALLLVTYSSVLGIPKGTGWVFVWLWFGTIAWNVEAPWRYHLRFVRDWSIPLIGLVIYFYSRGLTDELGLPVHYTMPIRFDERLSELFGGGATLPTVQLQHAWCGNPCLRASDPHWYDVFFTTVYLSHFVTGLTIAAILWVRRRDEWLKWMRRYLAINFGALAIYILYPMAPPWMASEQGYIADPIPRLTGRGWRDLGQGHVDVVLQTVGNPVAAMPSLHAGISFLVAMYGIWRLRSPLRFLLLLYPLAMCVTLVYYGEHYVVDVLAGAVLAALVMAGCGLWERRRARPPLLDELAGPPAASLADPSAGHR